MLWLMEEIRNSRRKVHSASNLESTHAACSRTISQDEFRSCICKVEAVARPLLISSVLFLNLVLPHRPPPAQGGSSRASSYQAGLMASMHHAGLCSRVTTSNSCRGLSQRRVTSCGSLLSQGIVRLSATRSAALRCVTSIMHSSLSTGCAVRKHANLLASQRSDVLVATSRKTHAHS
jgi:hypothetical protein